MPWKHLPEISPHCQQYVFSTIATSYSCSRTASCNCAPSPAFAITGKQYFCRRKSEQARLESRESPSWGWYVHRGPDWRLVASRRLRITGELFIICFSFQIRKGCQHRSPYYHIRCVHRWPLTNRYMHKIIQFIWSTA